MKDFSVLRQKGPVSAWGRSYQCKQEVGGASKPNTCQTVRHVIYFKYQRYYILQFANGAKYEWHPFASFGTVKNKKFYMNTGYCSLFKSYML